MLTLLVLEVLSHTAPGPCVSPPRHPSRLLGVDKVLCYALHEWLQDIRKNQLPGLLGGVGPMHSVVQLCECGLEFCFVWLGVFTEQIDQGE